MEKTHRRSDFILASAEQIAAVQAVYDAYMAINAAATGDDASPKLMKQLENAGRGQLLLFPGVTYAQAKIIWTEMCDNASGAQWNYDLWRKGDI